MNKNDLIGAVAQRTGLARKDVERMVHASIEILSEELADGEKIHIAGFGTFEVKERAARNGRNPMTGQRVLVAASRVPGFRAAQALKDRVAE